MKNDYIINKDGTAFVFTENGKGRLTGCFVVDADDLDLISKYKWHTKNDKYISTNVKCPTKTWVTLKIHRLILGAPKSNLVDHRNRDRSDNRRSNLRVATRAQNARNRGFASNNKLKIKGVIKKRGRYYASISCDDIKYNLGDYEDIELAATAYNAAAKVLFGEFAYEIDTN
jgi:hypothetical protein